jgi:hypothetical protein
MNCPSCSAPLKPGARFCAECGATVPQAPAYTDKTMIATPLPPAGDRTAPMSPGAPQQYGPPAPQPYAQPQQPQYGQPQQYGPPAQPQYGQPQYGQPQQPQYGQPVTPYVQAGNPYGYNVPVQAPVSPAAGRIPGVIMVLSSLAMVVAIFLPLLGDSSRVVSLYELLSRLSEFGVGDLPGEGWLFVAIAVLIVLSLLTSGLALWRRRNLWAVFSMLFGLVVGGFMGLMMIGAAASEDIDLVIGSGTTIMAVSGLLLVIASIAFMATRKAPR